MKYIMSMSFPLRFRILFVCFFLVSACYPAPTVPLETLRYDFPDGDHRQLFIFLPGNGDSPEAFYKNGLLAAMRERRLSVDVVAVNAHLGYYMSGTIFKRLKEDVIEPAKAMGYKKIWLVGNSLGGFGSVSYARQYPDDINGIVLLGPFLGDNRIINEIKDLGGLLKWNPGEIQGNSKDAWEREFWKWMINGKEQKGFWHWIRQCDEGIADCPFRIYLGYGKSDRYSGGQALMAEGIPPENVFAIEGGHNWQTWKELWNIILDRIASRRTSTRTVSR